VPPEAFKKFHALARFLVSGDFHGMGLVGPGEKAAALLNIGREKHAASYILSTFEWLS
jgi:hypothetical protein